ncbi:putative potassium transport system protein kup 1 [Magnetospirillum sp. LM-5]|uniref:potassium transporter Kup n=1 Tax=Magnetospirillum sp. LM-5 TaxID=2681466 RepID=UPI00137F9912|nr:potassium transporter Kup [Magnetospirillum sp. LM-5]CAA7617660.1 putative potassium transport system protein kup 1 [Magnetospirillum sp. LM-5]
MSVATSSFDTKRLAALCLGATGIVYGDIGTSPLYAIKECFGAGGGIDPDPAAIFGILSLVFWAIILVVSLKYVSFVLKADNRGEGGILALQALVSSQGLGTPALLAMGLFGAALFFGDGMITPAISVLSAIEGLQVADQRLEAFVVPLSLVVLVGLFAIQKHGTARVGAAFGPVMLVWFAAIGALGINQIAQQPGVLAAVHPVHGLSFLAADPLRAFHVLGSVVLVVTGGEALYADMGHFGALPIRLAWFGIAMPGLLLNYFGQGALILSDAEAVANPFYRMVPEWGLYPMVGLATAATVIASQAVISGVFSITRQAVQLGLLPRVDIDHTSDEEQGQIYIPSANWLLLAAVVLLVVAFGSSSALAAAYGIAVTGTMAITTIMALVVARHLWAWPRWLCLTLGAALLILDLSFMGANLLKIPEGGWVPLVVGGLMFALMGTWMHGRRALARRLASDSLPIETFLARLPDVPRVAGTAIFMTGNADSVPMALLHNLKHNKALHERVVFLRVVTEDIPRVPARDRVTAEGLADGFYRLTVRYGFFQDPDIPKALRLAKAFGLEFDMMASSFFVGHETILASADDPLLPIWRSALFMMMTRFSARATDFFRIPPNRVVELGAQVRL